ncbi:hypothetical protein [Hahella sp. HN01]|uniref:hypothetical protein n=1 Tax=Hahella sp. HN01 TaxID=2847262 RepID=UPI001C1F0AC9|nr:hypothetical protein [Hahella sp. HN01]MBU6953576.1 hypothetical protein [Hahella sp. HN01]
MGERGIYENSDFFTAFPDADAVFASEIEKDLLLPVGIYHLEESDGEYDILLAIPIGDDEGLIGVDNFGETCGETWLTYTQRDGRWSLDCSPSDLLPFDLVLSEAKIKFNQRRDEFLESGHICHKNGAPGHKMLFNKGDETTNYCNWYNKLKKHVRNKLSEIPGNKNGNEKLVSLYSGDGNEYTYLGFVEAGVYAGLLAQVHFFFCTRLKRVLVVHDFT